MFVRIRSFSPVNPLSHWGARQGWTADVRSKCCGLILSAKKTNLGGVVKYLTKQDQTKNFSTSFYWDEEEIEDVSLIEKLDRLFDHDS